MWWTEGSNLLNLPSLTSPFQMLCIIGSLANVCEKWETFQLACQDCAGSHASCRHVLILYGPSSVVLLPFTAHYMSFPSYFYWALEQLKPFLTAANSVTFPGCALPAHLSLSPRVNRKHGSTVLHRHSRINHALHFPLPPPFLLSTWAHHLAASTQNLSQHQLGPQRLRRSLSALPFVSKSTSQPPFFSLSAPFSSVINSNWHGPPTIRHHCFCS